MLSTKSRTKHCWMRSKIIADVGFFSKLNQQLMNETKRWGFSVNGTEVHWTNLLLINEYPSQCILYATMLRWYETDSLLLLYAPLTTMWFLFGLVSNQNSGHGRHPCYMFHVNTFHMDRKHKKKTNRNEIYD